MTVLDLTVGKIQVTNSADSLSESGTVYAGSNENKGPITNNFSHDLTFSTMTSQKSML